MSDETIESAVSENTVTPAQEPATQPRVARRTQPAFFAQCHRQQPQTVHLDKSKPVPDETQANQAALIKFQMQHALSMHQIANELLSTFEIDAIAPHVLPSDTALHTVAQRLSHYRARIHKAAQDAFGGQKLNRLSAKLDQQQPAERLTLEGHATQMVMTALRNTLMDQGLILIDDHLHHAASEASTEDGIKALFRLATIIKLLEVTRFNPLLAYHDIDHTLSVIQGSMALVAGAYDHAIAAVQDAPERAAGVIKLKDEKMMALHLTMLFSAAHDSYFEFKPNTLVRHAGRREPTSSEGLSAQNLKKLLRTLSEKLNHPEISEKLTSDALYEEIDEAIFATVPHYENGTVVNGAQGLVGKMPASAQSLLVRIATALADLEECLLPDPTRFITKSLLLNQEGSPIVDMSLIEHRSGVLVTLSEDDEASLKSALADETHGADFAEALGSWHRWMSSQPNFAQGRQGETAQLLDQLIAHRNKLVAQMAQTQCADSQSAVPPNDVLCLEGLIHTLLDRYAQRITDPAPTREQGKPSDAQYASRDTQLGAADAHFTVRWLNEVYAINRAGELAAQQIVADLEAHVAHSLTQEERLLSLAHILKRNLPPEVSRLTIPKGDNFDNLSTGALLLTSDAVSATSMRLTLLNE